MIDLDEVERQYAPFKEVPVCFVEYPQVNKLCAAVPLLIAELRAARKVVEAAKYIHWQCTQQRMENLHMALKELEGGEK